MKIIFDDKTERESLIDPDGKGSYYLRYLWINSKDSNEAFLENYFKPQEEDADTRNAPGSGPAGLNLRAKTKHLKDFWKPHNDIFYEAWFNGELVWRVKALNPISLTIDYIEVWKSKEYLEEKFTTENHKSLVEGILESGFIIKNWQPYQKISEEISKKYYDKFVASYFKEQNCTITTPLMGTRGRKYDPRIRAE